MGGSFVETIISQKISCFPSLVSHKPSRTSPDFPTVPPAKSRQAAWESLAPMNNVGQLLLKQWGLKRAAVALGWWGAVDWNILHISTCWFPMWTMWRKIRSPICSMYDIPHFSHFWRKILANNRLYDMESLGLVPKRDRGPTMSHWGSQLVFKENGVASYKEGPFHLWLARAQRSFDIFWPLYKHNIKDYIYIYIYIFIYIYT